MLPWLIKLVTDRYRISWRGVSGRYYVVVRNFHDVVAITSLFEEAQRYSSPGDTIREVDMSKSWVVEAPEKYVQRTYREI